MRPQNKTWFKHSLRAGAFWLIVPWVLGSCEIPQEVKDELFKLHLQVGALQANHDIHGHRLGQIEEYLTYCPEEVQRLVGRVEKECEKQDTCTLSEADIRIEVKNVAPWLGGKFQTLMQDRKHVAVYPQQDGSMPEADRKLIRDLVLPTWLSDGARRTRFLVVSYAIDSQPESIYQASKRGKFITREITKMVQTTAKEQAASTSTDAKAALPAAASTVGQLMVPALETKSPAEGPSKSEPVSPAPAAEPARLPHYLLHWALPFPRSNDPIKPEDRPRQPGDKVNTAVFIYRVDC